MNRKYRYRKCQRKTFFNLILNLILFHVLRYAIHFTNYINDFLISFTKNKDYLLNIFLNYKILKVTYHLFINLLVYLINNTLYVQILYWYTKNICLSKIFKNILFICPWLHFLKILNALRNFFKILIILLCSIFLVNQLSYFNILIRIYIHNLKYLIGYARWSLW